MKTKILGAIVLSLIFLISCEKEENEPINSSSGQIDSKSNSFVNKTTYTEFELMAMAANIEEISYSAGEYEFQFYGSQENHTISISTFNEEELIEMEISNSSTSYDIEINVENQSIDIQNVGTYTFGEYEDYIISSTENVIRNIMVIITVHHSMTPNDPDSFDDNGTDDEFDPEPEKFWGKTSSCFNITGGMAGSPCYIRNRVRKYRFWKEVSDDLVIGAQVACGGTCSNYTTL